VISLAGSGEHADTASVMPSRQPGAAITRSRRALAGDSAAARIEWPGDFPLAPPKPESLRRVLDGLKNLR